MLRFRLFTSEPHIAGSERQDTLINHIATKYREYGFDKVEIPEYQVLLSMPQEDEPNAVEVLNNGAVEYRILGRINVSYVSLTLFRSCVPVGGGGGGRCHMAPK